MRVFVIVMVLMLIFAQSVSAISVEEVIGGDFLPDTAKENISTVTGDFSLTDFAKSIEEGTYEGNVRGVLRKALDLLFLEVRLNLKIVIYIMALAIFYSFTSNFTESSSVREAVFLGIYASAASLLILGFTKGAGEVKAAIEDMGIFIKVLIPALSSVAIMEGKIISAPFLHTEVLFAGTIFSYLTEKILLPLIYISFALKFINNLSENLSLGRMIRITGLGAKRIMTYALLIFTTILSLSNFALGVSEGVSIKTAKFLTASFVPVAGGALAETITAVTTSATLIKTSVGVAGIVAMILMNLYPIIKCLALSLIYYISGAIIEPFCDNKLTSLVSGAGEAMGLILALLLTNSAMQIISTAILLKAV